jgi:3-hydroxybutyryl-CoA dehydrogenase
MKPNTVGKPEPVGLIGLGLMGQGIATCLLAHGFEVVAYNRTASRAQASLEHIGEALKETVRRKLVKAAEVRDWRKRYTIAGTLAELRDCRFIVETVKEDLELKRDIYNQLEPVVAAKAIIASNTSSIPITVLQEGRQHPERFIGVHWGEPAQIMRYLEIIPGMHTAPAALRRARELGERCGKKPTVLKFDIRGFISNRLMYAMMREAFHLVESGVADLETVDRSFRNDIGWWATLAGPFRWMDLTGIPAYQTVMEGLLPQLDNSTTVPELMKKTVQKGAQGVSNQIGFYKYTKAEAKQWEKAWVEFTYDVRKLVEKYELQVKL